MDMYEIVTKLIGDIEPYGDSRIDKERIKNLDKYINLVEDLLNDLMSIANDRNRSEESMRKIGEKAYNALEELYDDLDCYLNVIKKYKKKEGDID